MIPPRPEPATRRPTRRRCSRTLSGACAALVLTAASAAVCGPLHDPFLERFQVGTWPRPESVTIAGGFPAGLLEPARPDSIWLAAARGVLTGAEADGDLLRRLLRHRSPHGDDSVWLRRAAEAVDDLAAGRPGDPAFVLLRRERLIAAFGAAMERGEPGVAADLAQGVLADPSRPPLPPRARLVWRLRAAAATVLAQRETPATTDALWPEFAELGPFDTGNAWALWVATRDTAGLPVLPSGGDQAELGAALARVNWPGVDAASLYASALPPDWQAGLGGILLPLEDLPAHFRRFADPPENFAQQGWWVRGQRRLSRGDPTAYEDLARRPDLRPGWRLDVWRRASERRLLTGAWSEGLLDLERALALAARGHGTHGQRLRLRQWTEQALVLALAQDDLATARRIRSLGLTHLPPDEKDAFTGEIRHWAQFLDGPRAHVGPVGSDLVDIARHRVITGAAPAIAPTRAQDSDDFLVRADRQLWDLWLLWGRTLADPGPVAGDRRRRAVVYGEALAAGSPDDTTGLAIVSLRLGDRDWFSVLLRQALDADVWRRCGWQTLPWPSPVVDLLPEVRGSELDRHALLGFYLAVGDMRGTLGVAYELPGRGLTRAQKRLFLYPLPAPGPVRDAIAAAASEPALLLAVARNESLFEPAVRSRAGALGWMQIMPFHYPERGAIFGAGNWRHPAQSIARGDALLVENRRRYAGDPYRILAAYNAGPGAAARWDEQLGGEAACDVYLAWIGYTETRAYVEKVLIDREIYSAIIGANYGASGPGATNE